MGCRRKRRKRRRQSCQDKVATVERERGARSRDRRRRRADDDPSSLPPSLRCTRRRAERALSLPRSPREAGERERGLSGKSGGAFPRSLPRSLAPQSVCESRPRQTECLHPPSLLGGLASASLKVVKFTICLLIRSEIGGQIYISIAESGGGGAWLTIGREHEDHLWNVALDTRARPQKVNHRQLLSSWWRYRRSKN